MSAAFIALNPLRASVPAILVRTPRCARRPCTQRVAWRCAQPDPQQQPSTPATGAAASSASTQSNSSPPGPDEGPASVAEQAPQTWQPGLAANTKPLDARVLFGELLSTYIFVTLSLCTGASSPGVPGGVANGAIIAAVVAAFMPVSGAHVNPAVTVALLATHKIAPARAAAFIPLQMAGSVLGAVTARALLGPARQLAVPLVNSSALVRAAAAEMFPIAVILVVVFLTAVATREEGGVGMERAPLYIALTVLACATAFPTAVFNPARAFGPAVVTGMLAHHWVFWIPPISAACVAAILCEHVFLAPTGKRKPQSWLASLVSRYSALADHAKTLGVAGLISYGILNTLYYGVALSICMIRFGVGVGSSGGLAGFAKAWMVTWSFSQVTKPLRLGLSVVMAPFIDRGLRRWRTSRQ